MMCPGIHHDREEGDTNKTSGHEDYSRLFIAIQTMSEIS